MPNGTKGIVWTKNEIVPRLNTFPEKLDAAIGALMTHESADVQDYMRSNAPWTDRTSNARNGLFAVYRKADDGKHTIIAYHTVPYGIWLEIAHSGRYAIIVPTLETKAPDVFRGVIKLMRKMR